LQIIQLIGQQPIWRAQDSSGNSVVEISCRQHDYPRLSQLSRKEGLIGEILVKAQLITQEQLKRSCAFRKDPLTGRDLGASAAHQEDIIKVILNQIWGGHDLFVEDGTFL
jgi:hypothetical protein